MISIYLLNHKSLRLTPHKLVLLLFALMVVGNSFGQDILIKGKVVDAVTQEALPGVNVVLKGTPNGTAADANGEFSISAPADGILLVSFIGYKTLEVPVDSRTVLSIQLETDAASLTEVVVVGYGTVEKKDATGTVAKVTSDQFNKGLITSPDQLVTGKIAGLQIVSSGEPGGAAAIRLRGVSINGETPLFVVDGVPLSEGGGGTAGGRSPLSFINPADIVDVTVLKDAAASAIYGARGANGVIIITTKGGGVGKPKFAYDNVNSVSLFTNRPDILTPNQFRAAINAKAPQELGNLGSASTDWLKEVTQLAMSTQHNLSVSGGVKKTIYRASFNYQANQGVLRKTSNDKYNLSLRLEQKLLNDNLTLTLNSKNGITKDEFGPNVIGAAAAFDPTRPVHDTTKATGGYFQWNNPLATGNPVASQNLTHNTGQTYRNVSNLTIRYALPFLKQLSLNANIALDYTDGQYTGITNAAAREALSTGQSKLVSKQTNKNILYEYYGNYKNTLGKHKVDATVGYAWQNFQKNYSLDYTAEIMGVKPVAGSPTENRLISFFGRLNYEYNGKYILTASMRRDGSTRFAPSKRWGMFPAAAVAWRILEEDFSKGLTNVFSELKLRASYGVTGNEQIGDYLYSTYYRYSVGGASYQFGNEYVPTLRPNGADPNLKWEETVASNIGIDAGVMNGRFSFSLDYYLKNVNDLLFPVAQPAGSVPADKVLTNIGQVRNQGIELVLNSVVIDHAKFRWKLGFNISYNKNKIVKLDNRQGINLTNFSGYESGGISGDIGQTIQRRKVGEPIDAFYVYRSNTDANGHLVLDPNGDGIQSKLELYQDINKDGIINENDRVIYKKPNPTILTGLTSNITYKNWDMAMTLRGSFGNYVYNNLASSTGYFSRLTDLVTNNISGSAFSTGYKDRQLFSDYYVQNASFVKLDNVSIGYNFDNIKIAKVRIFTSAQNVFTITKYKGMQPEVFNGIDNVVYPRSITLSLGVNVNFK